MLKSETNTRAIERRVLRAFRAIYSARRATLQATFEHGQWWITNQSTGSQWSVVDATGNRSFDGFAFERVTTGDED